MKRIAALIAGIAATAIILVLTTYRANEGAEFPGYMEADLVLVGSEQGGRVLTLSVEEGDLVMRSVVADATNDTALTRIDAVLGRVSGVTILTGQMLTQNMLASSTQGQGFSILEPGQEFDPNGPDLRAVSVSVPDDRAVAGTLVPGQLVDLIVTMAINPEIGQTPQQAQRTQSEIIPGPSTKVTLQSLTILARNGGLYILRTDLATAEKVAELTAAGGQFTFVLRADVDDRVASTDGSTIDTLIDEFGFPVPKPPDFEGNSADR